MKSNKLYAAVMLIMLMTLPGAASAHDMDSDGKGAWAGHHHKMCKSSEADGKGAKFCPMREAFKKDKALFKKMHAIHEKMHAVLAAQNFDKKAFLSLSNQMEQLRSEMMRHHAEAFASMAAKMSPEERLKMIKHFHEHAKDGWHHRDGQSHNNDYSNLNK